VQRAYPIAVVVWGRRVFDASRLKDLKEGVKHFTGFSKDGKMKKGGKAAHAS
jgi:hypothetical protein